MDDLINVYNALSTIPVTGIDNCSKMAGALKIISDILLMIRSGDIKVEYTNKENNPNEEIKSKEEGIFG